CLVLHSAKASGELGTMRKLLTTCSISLDTKATPMSSLPLQTNLNEYGVQMPVSTGDVPCLRQAILDHLLSIGLSNDHHANGSLPKDTIRAVHLAHRHQTAEAERSLIHRRGS